MSHTAVTLRITGALWEWVQVRLGRPCGAAPCAATCRGFPRRTPTARPRRPGPLGGV